VARVVNIEQLLASSPVRYEGVANLAFAVVVVLKFDAKPLAPVFLIEPMFRSPGAYLRSSVGNRA